MTRLPRPALAIVLCVPVLLGGCPQISGLFNTVTVEVFNDTDFDVAPRVRYDDDTNWLAALAPSEELAPSILEPGELITYNMNCDDVGVIFSDTAGQFWFNATIGQAGVTRKLTRDDEFDCGDTIQFHFVGRDDSFGVIVSVNGRVVSSE